MKGFIYYCLFFLLILLITSLSYAAQPLQGKDLVLQVCHDAETKLGCRLGLAWEDLNTRNRMDYRGTEVFHSASLIKVPIMLEVFRQVDRKKLSLEEPILVHKDFISLASGTAFTCDGLKEMESLVGKPTTVLRLTEVMITLSDNLATNLLMERAGIPNVNSMLRNKGIKKTVAKRYLQDNDSYEKGLNSKTTPRDMNFYMAGIARQRSASQASCQEMLRILSDQKYRSMIPAPLPPSVQIANKTGSITGVQHDSAIILQNDKGYVLTIMTDSLKDTKAGREEMVNLSKLIYELWSRGEL